MEYPKVNSLYKREPETKKLIMGDYACAEFEAINQWSITEKIDGTNIRIVYTRFEDRKSLLRFGGRTENAQIPADLYAYLSETFTLEKMAAVFSEAKSVVLFGEGYGPKIQSGGYYRSDVSFILFDAVIDGWWLERGSIFSIARTLEISEVPLLSHRTLKSSNKTLWTSEEIEIYVKMEPISQVATVETHVMEGVVARSHPQMLFRTGLPIMFKLKCKDFE